MQKHFVRNGLVKLVYADVNKENPDPQTYDEMVKAETPPHPNTEKGERAVLKYDGSSLFWEVKNQQ